MFSSIDPVSEAFTSPESRRMQWDKHIALVEKHKIPGARCFLYDSWMPQRERCYYFDRTKKKYDLTRLDPGWAQRLRDRVSQMLSVGCTPLLSIVEYCGLRSCWRTHAYNPVNNLQKWGPSSGDACMTDWKWYEMLHLPLFKMARAALKPTDRSQVFWEMGNEPPLKVATAGTNAQWAKELVSNGVKSYQLTTVVSAATRDIYREQKDWKRNTAWFDWHGVDSYQTFIKSHPPLEWDVDTVRPNTDGKGPIWSIPVTEIKRLLNDAAIRYLGLLWSHPPGFKYTDEEWAAWWKVAEPKYRVMGECIWRP